MKTKLFLLLAIMIYGNTFSQCLDGEVDWVDNVITTEAISPTSVYAAEINGDEYIDVLSSSGGDNTIAWYANDGNGNFSEEIIITNSALGAFSVHAGDINGDGYMDVLSASWNDDTIAWYENTNGEGIDWEEYEITTDLDGARVVYAVDLDNDGDMDVLCGSWDSELLLWYENLNGQGTDWEEHIIASDIGVVPSVYAADINEDGYLDVLSASAMQTGDDAISWFLNNGDGTFGSQQIIIGGNEVAGAAYVYAADLNSDGHIDVLSASENNRIAWYENDGDGNFSEQLLISVSALRPVGIYATLLDDDEYIDVLSASINDDKIAWYKNLGGGDFGDINTNQRIISTDADFAVDVYAAEINGDGCIDVLSVSVNDNKIAWYEPILSVNENTLVDFSIYPNPVSELLTISIAENVLFEKAVVYSLLGEKLLETSEKNILVSSLATGIYFIQVIIEGKVVTKQFIKE